MDAILDELDRYIATHPDTAIFRRGASDERIAQTEAELGLPIPDQYKRFLQRHDGGFIDFVGIRSKRGLDEAYGAWNSNHLLGLDELVEGLSAAKDMWWINLDEAWVHLPFCHTDDQEYLVFAPPPDVGGARAVIDVFHEMGPEKGSVIFESFESFLRAYLAGDGHYRPRP